MSWEQGPRTNGMRPSARAEGSLRSSGEPTGLPLARVADGCRHSGLHVNHLPVEEAEQ
jgi:hypothetical protein